MPTNYNPGEPVLDQRTGEPLILLDGSTPEVAPGLRVDRGDGVEVDGDDVVGAAWYRANKHQGESLRDATIGVPFQRLAMGQGNQALAVTLVLAEVRARTPGLRGVVGAQVYGLDPVTRVLRWSAVLVRADGGSQPATFAVTP